MPNHTTSFIVNHEALDLTKYIGTNNDNEKILDFQKIKKRPTKYDAGELWYNWNNKNWGTKWNSYWCDIQNDKVLSICTAWNTPSPIFEILAKKLNTDIEVLSKDDGSSELYLSIYGADGEQERYEVGTIDYDEESDEEIYNIDPDFSRYETLIKDNF